MRGRVKNGQFELDEKLDLPDGTELDVVLFRKPLSSLPPDERTKRETELAEFIAKAHAEGRRVLFGHYIPPTSEP